MLLAFALTFIVDVSELVSEGVLSEMLYARGAQAFLQGGQFLWGDGMPGLDIQPGIFLVLDIKIVINNILLIFFCKFLFM